MRRWKKKGKNKHQTLFGFAQVALDPRQDRSRAFLPSHVAGALWTPGFGEMGVPAPAGCVHCGGCHTLVALPSLLQVSQSPRTTISAPARAARGSWLAHPGAGRGCEAGWGEGLRAPPHTSDPFPTCISSVPASGVCFQPFQMDPSTEVTWLGQGGPRSVGVSWEHLLQGVCMWPSTVPCSCLFSSSFSKWDKVHPARAAHGSSSWSGQRMQSWVGRGSDAISSPCRPSPHLDQLCPALWLVVSTCRVDPKTEITPQGSPQDPPPKYPIPAPSPLFSSPRTWGTRGERWRNRNPLLRNRADVSEPPFAPRSHGPDLSLWCHQAGEGQRARNELRGCSTVGNWG